MKNNCFSHPVTRDIKIKVKVCGSFNRVQFRFVFRKCSKNPIYFHIKVNESRNRPGVAQRVPGVLGSQIS